MTRFVTSVIGVCMLAVVCGAVEPAALSDWAALDDRVENAYDEFGDWAPVFPPAVAKFSYGLGMRAFDPAGFGTFTNDAPSRDVYGATAGTCAWSRRSLRNV